MSEKSHVGLECKICMVCGTRYETGAVLLDTRMRQSLEKYQITGDGLCPPHQKQADDDYIAIVEIDPTKSKREGDHMKPQDAYRTGRVAHIKRAVHKELFDVVLTDSVAVAYCQPEVMEFLIKLSEASNASSDAANDATFH